MDTPRPMRPSLEGIFTNYILGVNIVKVIETKLPGVLIIEARAFGDARGFFMETWQRRKLLLGMR